MYTEFSVFHISMQNSIAKFSNQFTGNAKEKKVRKLSVNS